MSGQPSMKSLVCEEVFDERSQPSEEEVREYAVRIGIDPEKESHLLPIAKDGLLRPLPKNWKPVYEPDTKQYYYFNFKTKQSSWEHPLDCRFRQLVKKSRSESLSSAGEEDSKTSIKEELKSFEEAAASLGLEPNSNCSLKDSQMDLSPQVVPVLKPSLSPIRSLKKGLLENSPIPKNTVKPIPSKSSKKQNFIQKPFFSSNLKDSPKRPDLSVIKPTKGHWEDLSSYLTDDSELLDDTKSLRYNEDGSYPLSMDPIYLRQDQTVEGSSHSVIGRFTVDKVRKIDIDSQTRRLDTDKADKIHRSSDRFVKSDFLQPELTLSGGGSVFLKSNRKRSVSINTAETLDAVHKVDVTFNTLETESLGTCQRNAESPIQVMSASPSGSASFRSILRTSQGERHLWDVDPQEMSVTEKALWKLQELEEEKKSVRFNLDEKLNISFKLSGSSDDDSSSEAVNVDGVEEVHSNGNDKVPRGLALPQHDLKKLNSPSRKEELSSPLDKWVKETWFSNKFSFEGKVEEVSEAPQNISHSDFDLAQTSQFQVLKEITPVDEHKNIVNLGGVTKDNEIGLTQSGEELHVDNSENPVASNSIKEVHSDVLLNHLSSSDSYDGSADSSLKKTSSPGFKNPRVTTPVTDLVSSEAKKFDGMSVRQNWISDNTHHKETSACEQTFRDWNVKKSDGEMDRPTLSRQQSLQQLQQIRRQIQVKANSGDRVRTLREWNVTDSSFSVEEDFSKTPGKEIIVDNYNIGPTESGMESKSMIHKKSQFNPEPGATITNLSEGTRDARADQCDGAVAATDFNISLAAELEKLKINYVVLVQEKEEEFKRKFEREEERIVLMYEAKLQKRIEEETKASEIKHKEVTSQLERESDIRIKQLREQLEHKQTCTSQQILEQHQQALAAQEVENQAAIFRIREQHSADMKLMQEKFQREEDQARREHQDRIVCLREDRDGKRSREITDHLRVIEKLRCEKHLVEDKYRTLKEKYIKLKGEMKSFVEKREKKLKENLQNIEKANPSVNNVVEPETSGSSIQQKSDRLLEIESKLENGSCVNSATSSCLGFQQLQDLPSDPLNPSVDPPPLKPNNSLGAPHANNTPFLGMGFSSPQFDGKSIIADKDGVAPPLQPWCNCAHLKTEEKNGNNPPLSRGNLLGSQVAKDVERQLSPLEALRHQLQTLDKLEEQFPVSSVTDAYLRYPFTDSGRKELESAELEFFRHRIHLERDMILQAKNSLQAQQSEYRSRLHSFQLRQTNPSSASPHSTLYQMAKEEQELSDMEAKLKRTQTVLSEKMIHLRHLENSLNRLTVSDLRYKTHIRRLNGGIVSKHAERPHLKHQRRWDWKSGEPGTGTEDANDDVSSDSGGSSGFSSTEYTSDGTLASFLSHPTTNQKIKGVSGNAADINQSLHNLNAEISEIWNVLCKQRAAAGLGPPPLLSTQTSSWTTSGSQHVSACAGSQLLTPSPSKISVDKNSSLIERTNNLRQWLQKAKISASLPHSAETRQKNVSF